MNQPEPLDPDAVLKPSGRKFAPVTELTIYPGEVGSSRSIPARLAYCCEID